MKFTVLTPTYNRAHTLTRLYESLKAQTFKDFEWLVIDDGSLDNTENLIKSFVDEKPFFNIVYKKQENGGKHRAINFGLPFAKGELTFFLDSDDWLLNNALEIIVEEEKKLDRENNKICGINGLKLFSNGKEIGSTCEGDGILATSLERKKYHITGDKADVYYTNIVNKYKFPEFEGEKFATEALCWNQMAIDGYKVWWFNKPIQYCEYLEDGLTAQDNLLYARNPKQWGLYIYENYKYEVNDKYYTTIQIYVFYLNLRKRIKFDKICEYLCFSKVFVVMSIIKQKIVDMFRFLFNKGRTIKRQVKNDT